MSTEKTIETTRGARGRASKKSIATRDVMTVAAMMVLTFLVCMVTGPLTMPFPFVYLYLCAGIQMFLCATFYLVVANRLNKHGVFLVWGIVYGTVLALSGYVFLLPYFAGVAAICELAMIGKDAYRSPVRNTVGWTIWAVGMVIGNAVPVWAAWDAYVAKATTDGFTAPVLTMQLDLLSNPLHLLGACAITAVLAVLGCLFGNRLLRKHFKKAGIVK